MPGRGVVGVGLGGGVPVLACTMASGIGVGGRQSQECRTSRWEVDGIGGRAGGGGDVISLPCLAGW